MWGAQGWNQWALQPAMFNDVPHEQIDWAALAKQWIQMQQTQPPEPAAPPLLPPVPTPAPSAAPLPIIPPPPPGHGPVVPPEDFSSDAPVGGSLLKTPVAPGGLPESFQTDRPFETETAGFVQKPLNNAYWNKTQWEASAAGDIDERVWTGPSIEPASSLIAGKETYDYGHMHDNPPLTMQSIDYNHMSEFSYNQVYPTENQYDQYWSQVNAAPPISPMFLKKEHTSTTSTANASLPVEEDTSQIDAAKRKQLPAWIREGLEKMEQERIKKLEKEKSEKEKAKKLAEAKLKKDLDLKDDAATPLPVKSKFDSDSDVDAEEENTNTPKESALSKRSPSPVEDIRTEEEKRQEYMLNIRRILTEVLLTVTNAEMYSIAEEVLRKERLKARQLASTASLTSVASGLRCLANYGSESEASDAEEEKEDSDSDEELCRRIREKKKLFAIKEKKIIAELERKELEEQNEALKSINETLPADNESEPENTIKESEKPSPYEEIKSVGFIPPSDVIEQVSIPFLQEENAINNPVATVENSAIQELRQTISKNSRSSESASNSSGSESESGEKHKKKSDKSEHDRSKNSDRSKESKKDKSPRKHHRHRSSDSDSSDRLRKSSRSYDKTSKKSSSYKKKKKYKRSDSSSSSNSSTRRRKYSSKPEASHNHSRERRSRSRSYEDRDRRRRHSVSPKSYRSSRESHRSRDSYSHRHEKDKYLKRDKDKYYDYKRSPSPYRRSSKLPKKYRSSKSPSSERENSIRKSKKSRTR